MPATNPENKGAFEAKAMPRHKGSATRETTKPALRSRGTLDKAKLFLDDIGSLKSLLIAQHMPLSTPEFLEHLVVLLSEAGRP
jgi:hypothetical protein